MTLVFYGIGRNLMTGMVVHGNDWLSFRNANFISTRLKRVSTALRQGRVMSQIILYSVCGNNYKICSVRSDLHH